MTDEQQRQLHAIADAIRVQLAAMREIVDALQEEPGCWNEAMGLISVFSHIRAMLPDVENPARRGAEPEVEAQRRDVERHEQIMAELDRPDFDEWVVRQE